MIFKSGDVTNFEIIAVCDLDIKKAEKLSEKFNCKYFDDISNMILYNKPDLILILTPSGDHYNSAKNSLLMKCKGLKIGKLKVLRKILAMRALNYS